MKKVQSKPKPAIIEICYRGGEHWYRCPSCETLNINGLEDKGNEITCPDCGQKIITLEVQICDCK